jgi:hypothetical protein
MPLYSDWRHDSCISVTRNEKKHWQLSFSLAAVRILLRFQDRTSIIHFTNFAVFGYRIALDQVIVQSSFLCWSVSFLLQETHHQHWVCIGVCKHPTKNGLFNFIFLLLCAVLLLLFHYFMSLTCTFFFITPFIPVSLFSCTFLLKFQFKYC